jgi:LytR cell envelope-related transcriptional attenuator
MVLFAFSIQDQVEKYGAYVGLAAFLGLAVLTVLYFAQARELKRLRDWAGRAPERAQEMEARVVATAEEARRAQAVPAQERSGTVGPAQPAVAAIGNGRPAGKPAPIPIGPRPATAVAAAAARAQATAVAAPAEPTTGDAEEEAIEEEVVLAPANGDGDRPAEPASQETQLHDTLGEDAEPEDEAPIDEPEAEETLQPEPEPEPEPEPAGSGNGNGVAAEPQIPRATPRPQAARPEPVPAAPLRAAATRSATVPPRRGSTTIRRGDGGSSRAARITAITLASIVALGAVVFAATQIFGSDEENPAPNVAPQPTSSAAAGGGGGAPSAAEARPETVVAILNGTPTQGLASQARDKLTGEGYSEDTGMIRTGNNTDQQRQDSAIYYAPGKRRQARDVASILGISARPEAVDQDTLALANGVGGGGDSADVVAVLGLDQSP